MTGDDLPSSDRDAEAGRGEDASARPDVRVWGPVATVVIAVVATLLPGVIVTLIGAAITGAQSEEAGDDAERAALRFEELATDGDFLGLAIWASVVVGVPLLLLALRLRGWARRGAYLPFRPVPPRSVAKWVALGALALVASDAVLRALGRTTTPEVWLSAFATADFAPLLWSAAVVAAPLSEELIYRGFVVEGLARTRLGPAGAVGVAAFVWALGHFDYGADHLVVVFVLGLVLGWARLKTASLWTPIIVHALWNLAAVVSAELMVSTMR